MEKSKRDTRKTRMEEIARIKGEVCVNCGSSEKIEYHHIVPLALGGNDYLSNIVPLCYRCHKAAHNGRDIHKYCVPEFTGRHTKNSDEEAFKAFGLFASGLIGTRKCKEILKLSEKSHISDLAQYKKFLQLNGIVKLHNNVDVVGVNGSLKDGAIVGYVEYTCGKKTVLRFKDTGQNAVIYRGKKFPEERPGVSKTEC